MYYKFCKKCFLQNHKVLVFLLPYNLIQGLLSPCTLNASAALSGLHAVAVFNHTRTVLSHKGKFACVFSCFWFPPQLVYSRLLGTFDPDKWTNSLVLLLLCSTVPDRFAEPRSWTSAPEVLWLVAGRQTTSNMRASGSDPSDNPITIRCWQIIQLAHWPVKHDWPAGCLGV